jgi:phage baseplate assembly protein W
MAANPQLLTDLRLELQNSELRPVYRLASELRRLPHQTGSFLDFATVSDRQNLAQAVWLRLLTPRGELAELGHPDYGSRLHELVGQKNTATTRNLMKLYILESLQQEPRLAKIEQVAVTPVVGSRTRQEVRHLVQVLLQVKPIAEATSVTIGPLILELQP